MFGRSLLNFLSSGLAMEIIPDDEEDCFVFLKSLMRANAFDLHCQDFPPPMPKAQPQDLRKRRKAWWNFAVTKEACLFL